MKENKIMVRNIERVETNGWKYRTPEHPGGDPEVPRGP